MFIRILVLPTQPNPEKKVNPLSHILVVDDNSVMQIVLCETLRQLGFALDQIETAGNGREALLLLQDRKKDQQFQAVFTDIEMPVMDGLELLRRIRTDLNDWQLPVFLVTSLASEATKRQALAFGRAGFISKPYQTEDIRRTIKDFLL